MSSRSRTVAAGLFVCAVIGATPHAVIGQNSALRGATPVAQVAQVALNGVVKDRTGAAIVGAAVAIANTATRNAIQPTVTNAIGAYAFLGLPIGTYKVTITKATYKTYEVEARLDLASTYALTTVIESGRSSEVVQLIAGSALTRTDGFFTMVVPRVDAVNEVTLTSAAAGADASGQGAIQVRFVTRSGTNREPQRQSSARIDARSGETYSTFQPNHFESALDNPLSTFGADVDTASYSNIRRFLSGGQLPPREAVRLEEVLNYFRFGYTEPRDGQPIALTTEIGECPWAPTHKLVLIGARAAAPVAREAKPRNLVLLVDVSGSMDSPERLPLIKTALDLFVETLRPDDSLAIVTYAGASGVALPPTPAARRDVMLQAIANLTAGGSTNGGEGIVLAYRTARQAFKTGGVNRVILATDGDFNVGVTSQQDLLSLIERERKDGVFLSVLGVGSGNLKDATMEMLADHGNGNYAYLDSLQEARRVLIREGDATLEAVAKDVKFQVEFNPAVVSSWKLIGYENRALAARDFNDDRKDAGDMGAGHTVTVLYEVIPVGEEGLGDLADARPSIDPLKYQPQPLVLSPSARPMVDAGNGEWLTVKTRFKMPDAETSTLIVTPVEPGGVQHLPLAAAIAEFGLILRDAPRNTGRWDALARRMNQLSVPAALSTDVDGLKELAATARGLARIR